MINVNVFMQEWRIYFTITLKIHDLAVFTSITVMN